MTLSATGGVQNSVIGSLLSLPSRYWSLGAALAQPIFDAGLRSAQKAQAIATYDETVANYRSIVLSSFQDVEDNLAALDLLAQEVAYQDDAVKAGAARRRQSHSISTGREPPTTWPSSCFRPTRLNNERTALAIQARRLAASVGLIKALGGGWNADALAQAKN